MDYSKYGIVEKLSGFILAYRCIILYKLIITKYIGHPFHEGQIIWQLANMTSQ